MRIGEIERVGEREIPMPALTPSPSAAPTPAPARPAPSREREPGAAPAVEGFANPREPTWCWRPLPTEGSHEW